MSRHQDNWNRLNALFEGVFSDDEDFRWALSREGSVTPADAAAHLADLVCNRLVVLRENNVRRALDLLDSEADLPPAEEV